MSKTSGETELIAKTTIEICKNEGILTNYFNERENEITEIILNMFEEQERFLAYVLERKVVTAIEIYKEVGKSFNETVKRIIEKFSLTKETAAKYVKDVWENKISSEDYD